MTTFHLPDLGEGLTEAEIIEWHVGVGERVVADQPLISVETAKAVVEVPSPWSGRIARQHGAPGDIVPVNAPLADIEAEGEAADAGTVVGRLPESQKPRAQPPSRPVEPRAAAHAKASPAVRRRAAELGVDLAGLTGSGPLGAMTRADVEARARVAPLPEGWEALRGVRRAMADAMARSGSEVVPATVTDEAVIESWPPDADATIRLVCAIAAGCRASPHLNAWFDGARKARRLHTVVDLGIAMETEDGLFAPVLRNIANRGAEDLRSGLEAIKRDVVRRTVPLAELTGQTITLSNFGMLGGLHAALTIVPPQVAILGAGRIHRAPRVVAFDVRAVRVLPLSLTFDHRAVTGAEAIAFLAAVVAGLEKPLPSP